MGGENFWNNREAAQKVVEETSRLRKRIEPLRVAENQLADLVGMVELGQAEPESNLSRELKSSWPQPAHT